MGIQKSALSIISLVTALLISSEVQAAGTLDLLKLRCVRQDRQDDRVYLSEIHFEKTTIGIAAKRRIQAAAATSSLGQSYPQIEGDVMSYAINGQTKQYISGYSLFSISFNDDVISGLTGDPNTRTDGSFTLTRQNQKNNGIWRFAYTSITKQSIAADFKCVYAPSPSDIPSR